MTNFALFLLLCLILLLVTGYLRMFYLQNSTDQKKFLTGKVPAQMPDGQFIGFASGYSGSWQGKKFDRAASTGINLFQDEDRSVEKYPFKTSVGKGVHDNLNVIKIDYNVPQNPFYLRLVLDEIVQVGDDQYLGKLHIRFLPGQTITVAFFELKK